MSRQPRIISIIGPESTGKTTLAKQLAEHLSAALVHEFAREFLTELGRPYGQADLLTIAEGQWAAEQQALAYDNPTVVCDTDLTVIKVWSDAKYNATDPTIIDLMHRQPERLHLLMRPDIVWEPDPLRENPDDRDELFERYLLLLDDLNADYAIVDGLGEARFANALRILGEVAVSGR